MNKGTHHVNVYSQRDGSNLILVVEKKTNLIVMRLIRPPSMHIKPEEIGDALYRYFNLDRRSRKKVYKHLRNCILSLPEEYVSILVCKFLTIKKRLIKRKDDRLKDTNTDESEGPQSKNHLSRRDYDDDERGLEPIEFIGGYAELKDYTTAKLCGIDWKTYQRRWYKIQNYLKYLMIYLRYQKKFDATLEKALDPKKIGTRELTLFKDLLLNPFQTSDAVRKKYQLKRNVKGKSSKNISSSSIRQYLKRALKKIISKARQEKKLSKDLLQIHYNIVPYFKKVFSVKASKKPIFKIPRMKKPIEGICEDRFYDLYEKEAELFKSEDEKRNQ